MWNKVVGKEFFFPENYGASIYKAVNLSSQHETKQVNKNKEKTVPSYLDQVV